VRKEEGGGGGVRRRWWGRRGEGVPIPTTAAIAAVAIVE